MVLAGLAASVALLAGCGSAGEEASGAATAPATQSRLTNGDWVVAHSDAAEVVGREVELRGWVFDVADLPESNETAFLVWVDFDNDELPTAFVIQGVPPELEANAFVVVRGVVEGSEPHTYPDGREALIPRVRVTALTITDRLGIRPAVWVVDVGQTLTQVDIRVTLERIEFAAEETRLLFAVENRSDETISAIGTGVRVQRGEVEFRAVFPTGHGVPPPRGRVESGAVERGWFQFPPLDRVGPPLVIIWDGAHPDAPVQRYRPWQWVVDTAGGQRPEG
ncbi:MAG: hypothetical protein OXG79_08380 [Chloroflexi bacterium]|nr:hypothetical protein [Chloroflexota bacterium]